MKDETVYHYVKGQGWITGGQLYPDCNGKLCRLHIRTPEAGEKYVVFNKNYGSTVRAFYTDGILDINKVYETHFKRCSSECFVRWEPSFISQYENCDFVVVEEA